MKSTSRSALLAIAALGAIGGLQIPAGHPTETRQLMQETRTVRDSPAQKPPAPVSNPMRALLGVGLGNSRGRNRRKGPGWTHANVQRMARKARNVKRHRASLKG